PVGEHLSPTNTHVTLPSGISEGPVGEHLSPTNTHVTLPSGISEGPVGEHLSPTNTHVTLPSGISEGPVGEQPSPSNTHVTLASGISEGNNNYQANLPPKREGIQDDFKALLPTIKVKLAEMGIKITKHPGFTKSVLDAIADTK
ncbi:Hypothetical predicted protein, partial [Paramuricea clavata]